METLKTSVASFDNSLADHDKQHLYAAALAAPLHSTTINMHSYMNGIHRPPKLSYQTNSVNINNANTINTNSILLDNSLGYAQGVHVNANLNSLLARLVARVPWKVILQRVPGIWLIGIITLAIFGPTSCPTFYYIYLGILNVLFLVNNLRTLHGIKFAYGESVKQATTDWLGEYLRLTGATAGDDLSHDMPYDHILHVLIIPNYSEDVDTLCETLDVLASHRRALTQYRICLAMEENEIGCVDKARMLMKMYSDCFFDITFTVHPANQPNEIRGKSSNVAFASKEMARYSAASAAASAAAAAESYAESIYGVSAINGMGGGDDVPFNATRHDHEIITILDADTIFAEDYFAAVACHYATAAPSQRKIMMFMPSTVFDRNSDQVPIFVRTCDTYWSLGVMSNMYATSPVKFPCSAYSISMDLAISVNFWDYGPESIGEDLHMYLKCFFATSGKLVMKPIYSAVSCCNIEANTTNTTSEVYKFVLGLFARYDQAKRHLWGSLDTGYIMKRTIIALFAPGFDNVIQMKNTGVTKEDKEDLGLGSQTSAKLDIPQLRCLFHRALETHCLMGHFAILGLVRSIMAQLPNVITPAATATASSIMGPLPKSPLSASFMGDHFGIPITFDMFSGFIIFCCVICNFLSASYYEKYYKFQGFERWALQTLPAKSVQALTKFDKFSMDNAATVANNRLVGLATMAKHGLRFSKKHERLQVHPLGRRPQLSSPRYAINFVEWCLIPYVALFYFVMPQCHAQIVHLFTDKLDYNVSAKPQLRTSSLAALTMEEVVASAKGFSLNQDWNGSEPYAAQVVSLGGSESDSKSVTLESEASGFFEEDF
ncbi:UNVERIFIED_CONTAM: hypothetical protein HDU68_008580 [Siphonaria sp. JEL0065]|nr:hypothetical protein HDU68_008580 [Siphonaria sp. JEL0065]